MLQSTNSREKSNDFSLDLRCLPCGASASHPAIVQSEINNRERLIVAVVGQLGLSSASDDRWYYILASSRVGKLSDGASYLKSKKTSAANITASIGAEELLYLSLR